MAAAVAVAVGVAEAEAVDSIGIRGGGCTAAHFCKNAYLRGGSTLEAGGQATTVGGAVGAQRTP